MTKRRPGKLWFKFQLFGLEWEARLVSDKSPVLEHGKLMGRCYFNTRVIYVLNTLTHEQLRTTLAHEMQHAIEDHAGVEHQFPAAEDVSDRWTDQIALGWLYVIRHCPDIVSFLRAEQ
jgi:Zn-dependent peptidase ImmA (M78 family)